MVGFERWAVGAFVAMTLAGCGSGMTVRGEVIQPAQVPVRAFPRILVTSAEDPESREIALAIARHLAVGRSTVDRLDRSAIAELRARGQIDRTTVVLELRTTLTRHERPGWATSDPLNCGVAGCVDSRRSVEDVPVVRAHVSILVAEGPSGRPLQRVELSEQESGSDVLAMRLRVLERLATRARALVDQQVESVPVTLYPLDMPEVRAALEAVREGRWAEGRQRLERFVESKRFQTLPRDQRALVLYDLGQARRFDSTLPAERRFRDAARALRAAVRLVPQPRYAQAIADLERHRQSRAMVREQQEAMAHNFALGSEAARSSPAPPSGYRD